MLDSKTRMRSDTIAGMSTQGRTPAIADVYAADTAQTRDAANADGSIYAYSVEADPDPDVLARIAGVCNIANIAPRAVHFERTSEDRVKIRIDLDGISASTADSIRRKLLQLTCVSAVSLA